MFPSLAIPKLGRPATPPRSPHVETPQSSSFPFLSNKEYMTSLLPGGSTGTTNPPVSATGSTFSTASSSSVEGSARAAVEAPFHAGPTNPYSPALRARGSRNIRPTRRDVLLCSLTLVFAWLLFSGGGKNDSDGRGLVAGRLQDEYDDSAYSRSSREKLGLGSDGDGGDLEDDTMMSGPGYLSKHLSKLGNYVPGLGGWLGSKGTTRGHGQGDFGIETICEVGSGGTVKIHGYSDSVAKVSLPGTALSASETIGVGSSYRPLCVWVAPDHHRPCGHGRCGRGSVRRIRRTGVDQARSASTGVDDL